MNAVTEAEASEKWCPFAMVTAMSPDGRVRDGQTVFNRIHPSGEYPGGSWCVGRGCMAWRWAASADGEPVYAPSPAGGVRIGYCGLAGSPTP